MFHKKKANATSTAITTIRLVRAPQRDDVIGGGPSLVKEVPVSGFKKVLEMSRNEINHNCNGLAIESVTILQHWYQTKKRVTSCDTLKYCSVMVNYGGRVHRDYGYRGFHCYLHHFGFGHRYPFLGLPLVTSLQAQPAG